ncbi:hypothetical protein ZIOFF_036006 [Zingiber officinale]|uniref:FPL domain-containing protein n=1 Tax=Zingiber officinale TaxID=94328 RepID=A0A8J5L344_ZINOF|nr:hypothetical protein ZIOFF_036006 [Zingiber officinale]
MGTIQANLIEEIVSFPLYVEAIRFAFHDENMIRIAVHALTLNVYHGVPDLGRLLTDNILQLLVFPFLLPSLRKQNSGTRISIATSLHLLCSILHIFKTKDLASTIAAAFFCPIEAFVTVSEATINGSDTDQYVPQDSQELSACHWAAQVDIENSESPSPNSSQSSSAIENSGSYFTLR